MYQPLSTLDKLAADQVKGKAVVAFALAACIPAIGVYYLEPTFKGLVVLLIFGIMIAFSLGGWLYKNLMKPLKMLAVRLERLSLSHHDVDVPFIDRKDEIGDMARSIEILKDVVLEKSSESRDPRQLKTFYGDKRNEAVKEFADQLAENVLSFGRELTRSSDTVAKLAQAQSGIAHQVSIHSDTIDFSVNQNIQTLEGLIKLMDDLHKAIAKSAMRSAEIENALEQVALTSHQTDVRAQGLLDHAEKVKDISKAIKDVASQTHILALNASLEAVKGKEGNAQLSIDVKDLANHTAKASEEIGHQIEAIQQATMDTVVGLREAVNFIQEFSKYAKQVTKTIKNQESHCKNIMMSVQSVGQSTKDIRYSLSGLRTLLSEVKGYADEINQKASSLSGQTFNIGNHFEKMERGHETNPLS